MCDLPIRRILIMTVSEESGLRNFYAVPHSAWHCRRSKLCLANIEHEKKDERTDEEFEEWTEAVRESLGPFYVDLRTYDHVHWGPLDLFLSICLTRGFTPNI